MAGGSGLRQGALVHRYPRLPSSPIRFPIFVVVGDLGQIHEPFLGLVRPFVPGGLRSAFKR
eukprot:7721388-Heterocapsa_arctica.AAC.1